MEDLKQRHYELNIEALLFSREGEEVREKDSILVAIENKKPERLIISMILVLPFEISLDGKLDFEATSRDWLGMRVYFNSRHVVN